MYMAASQPRPRPAMARWRPASPGAGQPSPGGGQPTKGAASQVGQASGQQPHPTSIDALRAIRSHHGKIHVF